jgi:transcriptional regulator with PAS, ATPase and Fis domain
MKRGVGDTAIRLIEYLTNTRSSFLYAQSTGYLPGSIEQLGSAVDALRHETNLQDSTESPDTYMEYLVSIGASDDIVQVIEKAIDAGRTYPPLGAWAQEVEATATRIGLYHLWQDLAAHESPQVVNADLRALTDQINDDLYLSPLRWRIAGLAVGILLLGLIGYILWHFILKRRLKQKQSEILSLTKEIDSLIRGRAELQQRIDIIQRQMDQSTEKNTNEVKDKRQEIDRLRDDLAKKEKQIVNRNGSISDLENEKTKLVAKLRQHYERQKARDAAKKERLTYSLTPALRSEISVAAKGAWGNYRNPRNRKIKYGMVYGQNGPFKKKIQDIERLSDTPAIILVIGESGTGKELAAKAIHTLRKREGRFEPVSLGGFGEELASAELFGSCTGAFTGAVEKEGALELADSGTVFLDEIGDMSLGIQGILRRALQEREFKKFGGRKHENGPDHSKEIPFNADFIAATNVNLEEAMKAGQFRVDLYYRIDEQRLHLLPLRERRSDIPLLIDHFVRRYALSYKVEGLNLEKNLIEAAVCYHWPGNVRELGNFVKRILSLKKDTINLDELDKWDDDLFRKLRDAYDMVIMKPIIQQRIKDLAVEVEQRMTTLLTELRERPGDRDKAFARFAQQCDGQTLYVWMMERQKEESNYREQVAKSILFILYNRMKENLKDRRFAKRKTDLAHEICRNLFGFDESTFRNWENDVALQEFRSKFMDQ